MLLGVWKMKTVLIVERNAKEMDARLIRLINRLRPTMKISCVSIRIYYKQMPIA